MSRKVLTKKIVNERLIDENRTLRLIGEYFGIMKKTLFKCLVCNYEWDSRPDSIINCNIGCPKCGGTLKLTKDIFNEKLQKTGRCVLLIGEYFGMLKKSMFKCLICNYEWEAIPNNIKQNKGCPNCAKTGFDSSKPAILYYLKIKHDDNEYYKIGITNKSIEERFKYELNKIEPIFSKKFNTGKEAYEYEQQILKQYSQHKYIGESILKSGGNTEIFIKDIFNGAYHD